MNAITYFKLQSPYDGDITKNCALTGSEVDNNFYTLEGRDIKSVELIDDKIVVNLINGDKLTTDKLTDDCVKELDICFDEVNGILTIVKNGVTQRITGFATNHNVGQAISVDGSIVGNGLADSPIGISPVYKTGQYAPVKCIIDRTKNEAFPSKHCVLPGDRVLTIEKINDYGYLYNYNGLKKIACKLREIGSEWRIPSKQDWDDMLNAIEPCDDVRNHDDARSNKFLGKFAGKFLKSTDKWKKEEGSTYCEEETCFDYTDISVDDECSCGKHIQCHPNYCGEYGHCRHRHKGNHNGIDKYGFRILPAGYATEAKDYLYFRERAYFWTASNHEYRDAYIKSFAYNKSNVLQDIFASDNYLSVRLVKNYNGNNYNECEDILGSPYSTILMPSVEHGKAIWTSVNISIADCCCDCHCNDYVLPNNGEGMDYVNHYFISEWNGKEWLKKELSDGDSVVVINEWVENNESSDEENNNSCCCNESTTNKILEPKYNEYRLENGQLVNVSQEIYDKVAEIVDEKISEMDTDVDSLRSMIEGEIERSTTKDNEIDAALTAEEEARITKDEELEAAIQAIGGNIEAAVQAEAEARIAKDNELEAAIQAEAEARAAKDNELEAAIQAIDNNIESAVQAEAEARIAKDNELEAAIQAEAEARIAKDNELEAAIQAEAEARIAKDNELDTAIQAEAEARAAKDEELDGKTLIGEGTQFNEETGILSLKSKDGTNDIQVQFNMNFGTF